LCEPVRSEPGMTRIFGASMAIGGGTTDDRRRIRA
jgi:hypothetical protein